MPRAREFDENKALLDAMGIFWKRGFLDTSVDDLVQGTGVQRYGLYSVLGGKKKLFLKVLDVYEREVMGVMLALLDTPNAGLAEIDAFFAKFEAIADKPIGKLGCLMCLTSVESAPHDAAIAKRIRSGFQHIEIMFLRALQNARSEGELASAQDPAELSRFFLGALVAMATLARSPVERKVVKDFIHSVRRRIGELRS